MKFVDHDHLRMGAVVTGDPKAENALETPVEIWRGKRKVSVYEDVVIRVWGPCMDTEMSQEPRSLESVQSAVEWLYAA